ncbi:MAG: hypothetical protein ACD_19C00062G0003 [uncultured bacterium]|nr:MAG: hypothetical protein ACD_19C00062G0003 [uncultured bacterium]
MIEKNKHKTLIIISERDPVLSRVCKYKFNKNKGWHSHIINSYSLAWKKIKKEKPQIILTDIILEGGDGFKLIKKIRRSKDKDIAKTPIIILTELSQNSDRERALDLGATEYFVKSEVSINTIIEKIKELTKKHHLN